MGTNGWITVAVIGAMVVVMGLNLAAPDLVLMAALTMLLLTGVIDVSDAFDGFSNPAVLAIAALYVVARGMQETGATDVIARRVLGRPRFLAGAQIRMMLPVSAMSAFLNNTPVVAMMVPIVNDWAKRTKISASMLLMPLSYAAIIGGTCTLIGTSTNLVVAGMATARYPEITFHMFEMTPIGLAIVAVGTAYVVIASRWLLTDRMGTGPSLEKAREYTLLMRVEKGSAVVNQTIEEAGLRHLPGLFLVEIDRGGDVIAAPGPGARLRAGDLLLFAGIVDSVVDLRKIRGLVPETDQVGKLRQRRGRRLVEAVVAMDSPLVGKSVRESRFRTRFNAAIIAVHRRGERIRQKVGDIRLMPGDVLLVETHPSSLRAWRNDPNFALASEVERSEERRHDRAWIAMVILVVMVAVNTLGLLNLVVAALGAAGVMLVTRCLTGPQARASLDVSVLLAVAASIGLGSAMESSGLADILGGALLGIVTPFGQVGVLAGIFVLTAGLAPIVSTQTAAALVFPIAASAAGQAGIAIVPMCYVVMIAAATALSSPHGYQTNLMVFSQGGYRFSDFLKLGLPLQALIGVVTVTMAWLLWL